MPATKSQPAGLFGFEHFQVAYLTNDLEQAIERFRRDYGVAKWPTDEFELPAGGRMSLALA